VLKKYVSSFFQLWETYFYRPVLLSAFGHRNVVKTLKLYFVAPSSGQFLYGANLKFLPLILGLSM